MGIWDSSAGGCNGMHRHQVQDLGTVDFRSDVGAHPGEEPLPPDASCVESQAELW